MSQFKIAYNNTNTDGTPTYVAPRSDFQGPLVHEPADVRRRFGDNGVATPTVTAALNMLTNSRYPSGMTDFQKKLVGQLIVRLESEVLKLIDQRNGRIKSLENEIVRLQTSSSKPEWLK